MTITPLAYECMTMRSIVVHLVPTARARLTTPLFALCFWGSKCQEWKGVVRQRWWHYTTITVSWPFILCFIIPNLKNLYFFNSYFFQVIWQEALIENSSTLKLEFVLMEQLTLLSGVPYWYVLIFYTFERSNLLRKFCTLSIIHHLFVNV